MLTTVDGSDDDGIGVEVVTENLTRIGKLEDTLAHLWDGSVNLIEEEKTCVVAALIQPVRWAKAGHIAIGARQTNEVALGHLRCAPLDDGQAHLGGHLIDKLRFANTVTTAKHERLLDRQDVRGNRSESLEIDSHDNSVRLRGAKLVSGVPT
tara:strand:+ start:257 stop:712 length:456 start_codon:yes stop_codon:yes gene_type:complete